MRHTKRVFSAAMLTAAASCSSAFADSGPPLQRFAAGGQFVGNFTVDQITDPLDGIADTNAFDSIKGTNVRFSISFDSIERSLFAAEADGGKRWVLTTSPAYVTFLGGTTYLQDVIAPTLNGRIQILIHEDATGYRVLQGFDMVEVQVPQFFVFACRGPIEIEASRPSMDIKEPELDSNIMRLQRYSDLPRMTDSATGIVRYTLVDHTPTPVGVETKTFGQIKAMYRSFE